MVKDRRKIWKTMKKRAHTHTHKNGFIEIIRCDNENEERFHIYNYDWLDGNSGHVMENIDTKTIERMNTEQLTTNK